MQRYLVTVIFILLAPRLVDLVEALVRFGVCFGLGLCASRWIILFSATILYGSIARLHLELTLAFAHQLLLHIHGRIFPKQLLTYTGDSLLVLLNVQLLMFQIYCLLAAVDCVPTSGSFLR